MQEALWARGCRRAVEACWLLVFAVVPICFSVDVYINFIHDKIPLFRSLVELGLLAAILRAVLQRKAPEVGTNARASFLLLRTPHSALRTQMTRPLFLAVGAYAAVLGLATLFGRNTLISWWGDYPRLFGSFTLLHGVLLFVLMTRFLTTRAGRWRWIAATLTAAAAVSLYAIVQRLGYDPYQWSGPIGTQMRPVSSLGNACCLGTYLVFVIPLTVGAMLGVRALMARAALGALLLVELVALGFTLTRGAWLGTGALLAAFGLLLSWKRGYTRLAWAALGLALAGAAVLLVINLRSQLVAGIPNRYVQRMANLRETQPGTSGWERLQGWQIALEAAHGPALLLGYGPQSYLWLASHAYRPIRSDYALQGQLLESSHNIFLDALVDTGLLGLAALLAMLGIGFTTGLRALRRVKSPADEALLIAALSALVGYSVQGLFLFDHLIALIFVMGCLAVVASIARTTNDERRTTNDEVNRMHRIDRMNSGQNRDALAQTGPARQQPHPAHPVHPAHPAKWSLVVLATALTGWCVVALNLNDFRADVAKHAGVVLAAGDAPNLDGTEAAFRTAVRLCPWQPAYHIDLAGCCMARAANAAPPAESPLPDECRRWMVEAERHLRRAIALEPRDYRPYLQLGQLYCARAVYEPACVAKGIQAYQAAAATTPGRQHVYWAWGDFCLAVGLPDAALDRYRYAVSLDPRIIAPHRSLAELYAKLGRLQPSEQEYEIAWSLEKSAGVFSSDARPAAEHETLAELFLRAGDNARAAHHLRETLALNASDARARQLLAQIAPARFRVSGFGFRLGQGEPGHSPQSGPTSQRERSRPSSAPLTGATLPPAGNPKSEIRNPKSEIGRVEG